MNKVFFTSDTHFSDEVALKYNWSRRIFSSIDEMNHTLITNWNKVVKEGDVVYHMGDFCNTSASRDERIHFRKQLNGTIHFMKGNHDEELSEALTLSEHGDHLYDEPYALSLPLENLHFWMCHYPIQRNLDYYTLTGHIHTSWRIQRKMLNVGVDVNNFIPLSLDDVVFAMNAEADGRWDANVYPDAPLAWQVHVSRLQRAGKEPTKDYLMSRMLNE